MTAIILQARINSTRFPNKVLALIQNATIIEIIMHSLGKIPAHHYILATNYYSYFTLAPFANAHRYQVVWGSENDVLQRYCDVIRYYRLSHVVRATGDNPLVSVCAAVSALKEYHQLSCDYFCYNNLPLGTGVEIVSAYALLRAEIADTTPYQREHVTPHIYHNPHRYNVVIKPFPYIPSGLKNIRLTLDTMEDFMTIQRVYAMARSGDIDLLDIDLKEIIGFADM